jgi:hypothetical protein
MPATFVIMGKPHTGVVILLTEHLFYDVPSKSQDFEEVLLLNPSLLHCELQWN